LESISKVQDDYIITPFQLFTQSSKNIEILQQHDIIPAPAYKILRDGDFKKLDSVIMIQKVQLQNLLEQLKNDTNFLAKMRSYNYSMLLYKVDRTSEILNQDLEKAYTEVSGKHPLRNLKELKSTIYNVELREIYWHIGIINFFEGFATEKIQSEQNYTKRYAARFLKYFRKIFTSFDDTRVSDTQDLTSGTVTVTGQSNRATIANRDRGQNLLEKSVPPLSSYELSKRFGD
jgi:hypothetical protein